MKKLTVHVHRTIMFAELEKVMNFAIDDDSYENAMEQNVMGKKSADGIKQTSMFLKRIYDFDITKNEFLVLKEYWKNTNETERPLIAFLYALKTDYLLQESIDVIKKVSEGDKVEVIFFEENVEKHYPNKYSTVTRHSIGKNLASSWKQVSFITGKVKNLKNHPPITHNVLAFAFTMAYLSGTRGDYILNSHFVKALFLNENNLRELAIEASKRGLIKYQYAGNVTSVNCTDLLLKLKINDN